MNGENFTYSMLHGFGIITINFNHNKVLNTFLKKIKKQHSMLFIYKEVNAKRAK